MTTFTEKPVLDFYLYPPVGENDWEYAFGAAAARSLETELLSSSFLVDLASVDNYESAVDMLSSTEYELPKESSNIKDLEKKLLRIRTETRDFFRSAVPDENVAGILEVRADYKNLRLALRRKLTEKPLGTDYNNNGTVEAEDFKTIFEEEDYTPLPYYMRESIEQAVLAYYQNKDVRQIDITLDRMENEYVLKKAEQQGNRFLIELAKMHIDLTNIKTMFRLRLTEPFGRDVFLQGGHVPVSKFKHSLDIGEEGIPPMFFATPYYEVVEKGITYYQENKSFLKLEAACEHHLMNYMKTASQIITAGPQPVVAYLLRKENEIRKIRLIMTGKKNHLDTRLLLDRLGE